MSKPEQNEAEELNGKKEDEKERELQAAAELKKRTSAPHKVSVLTTIGLAAIAATKAVLHALNRDAHKALASASEATKGFSGAVDPDLDSKEEKPITKTRGVLRALGQLTIAGLSAASAVFNALAGDIGGGVTDGLVVFDSGMKALNTILSMIPKGEPKPPGKISQFFSRVGNTISGTVKGLGNKATAKAQEYKVGRFAIRLGTAIYKAATSPQAKVVLQVAGAVATLAAAATPIGIAIASLSLGAVLCKGVKSYLNSRSLRHLKEKREALLSIEVQQRERARLLSENPSLRNLLDKGKLLDDKKPMGPLPKMKDVSLAEEAAKAGAFSVLGGSAAILQALTKDPLSQAGTGIVLLGGVAREAENGIKEQLSRSDLKRDIWKLGGDQDSLVGVEQKLLEQKRHTLALKMLAEEIKHGDHIPGLMHERFNKILEKVSVKDHPTPTFGDKVRSAFRGFGRDCDNMFLSNIRKGWRELKGEKVEKTAIELATLSDKTEARKVSREVEKAAALDLEPARASEAVSKAKDSQVEERSDIHTSPTRAAAYAITESSNGKITKKEDKRKSRTESRKAKDAKTAVATTDVNLTLVEATVIGASAKGHVTDPASSTEIGNATVIGASAKGHVTGTTSPIEVSTKDIVTGAAPSTEVSRNKARNKGVA